MSDPDTQIQGPRDLFSIRSQLAQQTNPLRAKMVLFSVLYHPFSYSSGDWSTLKQQDLGEFIRRVYNKFATGDALKQALMATARRMDAPMDCQRSAAAIVKLLKPHYPEAQTAESLAPADDPRGDAFDDLSQEMLAEEGDDNSQTWDIPIGVSLKHAEISEPSEPTDTPTTDLDASIPQLLTTGLSSATTAVLHEDTSTALETQLETQLEIQGAAALGDRAEHDDTDRGEDNSALALDTGDAIEADTSLDVAVDVCVDVSVDTSTDDHSRWLAPPEAELPTQSLAVPTGEQPEPDPESTPDLSSDASKAPQDTPASDLVPEPATEAKATKATKASGRRTALARVLTQHVADRSEVDAIVQRYSKALTECVTAALDDLEGELEQYLADRDTEDATQIAGEAIGYVLWSVNASIENMRHALERIPGVEPIARPNRDRLASSPQQTPQTPPQPTPPPALPLADRPDTDHPISSPAPAEPEPIAPSSDPIVTIREKFATILAKRDMSIFVKQRDNCIHIIAEANPLPAKSKLVRFVIKTLKGLDLPPIATLRLHGRRTDARAFDWSEDLPPIA